ncbi:Response regulator with diguanylate cyclase domain (modular protein) [Desulfosarcina cetonica]|nr:Response regulator with diguanylate cyclase domain (modular protein) [Desulfosarcina cetonica]
MNQKPVKDVLHPHGLVVVIENNTTDLILITRVLRSRCCQMLTAQNADDGLMLIENMTPDLVIVNTGLTVRDGIPLIETLRTHPNLVDIRTIALAAPEALSQDGNIDDKGDNRCIAKPLDPDNLDAVIADMLSDQGRAPAKPSLANPSLGPSTRARVLIVDDEVMNLKLFKAYLSSENYEILTAENGHDAIAVINQHPPDVILLDVMMPGIDGFEVTRRLKQNAATASIPIILVTALSGQGNKTLGLDAGADEFLTKPIQRAELVARVRSMLRLKRFEEQIRGRQLSEPQLERPAICSLETHERIPLVLIAEDNDSDALLVLKQLEYEPYSIKRVSTGEAAIREVLNEPVDLVLLDLLLPGIDGFEVCRRLKGDDRTCNIQIVMMTSLRDLDCRIQGAELGTDDYLVKPVDACELKARVNALLKKKHYIDKLHNRYENVLNRALNDDLTGLFNHGYFKRFLALETKRALRQKHLIALLLMDLDNFKQINDTLGHLTGDRILVQVAKKIRENIREIDFAARYGGEEFAVILPYTGGQDAKSIAERIRSAIHKEVIARNRDGTTLPVSASIGVAFCPNDGIELEDLIRHADEMMYLAKQCGKNQVCVSSDFKG